jgi:hypothetical protein
VKRVLPLAFLLCSASGTRAADPLTPDESSAAYCHGVAQARVLAYEQMAAVPCGRDTAQCVAVRQAATAALPRLRRELDAASRTLVAYGLLEDGGRPESDRVDVWNEVGRAIANGQREALHCLNMSLPGLADPGVGDIGESCRRIAACATGPSS